MKRLNLEHLTMNHLTEKQFKTIRLLLVLLAIVLLSASAGWIYASSAGRSRHSFSEEEAEREILFEQGHILTTKASYVKVRDHVVTIRRGGTYTFKGFLEEGQIVVDAGDDAEVKLKLAGVTLSCSFGPPIYIKSAKKVTLKLKAETENELSDASAGEEISGDLAADSGTANGDAAGNGTASKNTASYDAGDEMWKACIYARSDLKIKGSGELFVHGRHKHGIFSSKDLKIKNGIIRVDAERQALHGKKSILIESGDLTLKAGTDGVHSDGTLDITGGTVKVDARKYGLYARLRLRVIRAGDPESDESAGAVVTVKNALSEAGCQGILEY